MAIKLGDALLMLGADDDKLKKDLDGAESKAKGWGATMTGIFAGFGLGIFNAVSGAVRGAFDTIGESIGLASDLEETTSKVRTLFGESATSIEEWASTAASSLGVTKQAALDAVGTIGNVFLQMGESSDVAGDVSQKLVQLATDLGSFHNADPTEILDSINGALRGEYDSLQRYVPLINAAAVEQRALADTGKAAASELTALERATAVYELTIEGAGAATGDFARTNDGWANSMKTLNAYWTEFKTLLGETLLPVLTPLIGKVKDLASEWLPKLSDYIRTNVIPAIEEWAANFDSWWEEHAQPFLDDIGALWDDVISTAKEALTNQEGEFELSLDNLKTLATEVGALIGEALGENIGKGLQSWWDAHWEGIWREFFKIPAARPGSIAEMINNALFGYSPVLGGPPTPQTAPTPGSGLNPYAQSVPQAVTINNYVDATSRSVGEAARDGTLAGLQQAGMR